ncbi:MAG: hypothetical protein WBP81_31685 [Solirubrobacteraceae bacterium]
MIDGPSAVIGREHELAVLRAFVAERTGPTALVLEGDAGVGKTTLWEAGIAGALSAGHRVLRCRPVTAETPLSFAAVGGVARGAPGHGRRAPAGARARPAADEP